MSSLHTLKSYVIGVILVIAILVGIKAYLSGMAEASKATLFSGGFLLGMLAMYIAIRVYRR